MTNPNNAKGSIHKDGNGRYEKGANEKRKNVEEEKKNIGSNGRLVMASGVSPDAPPPADDENAANEGQPGAFSTTTTTTTTSVEQGRGSEDETTTTARSTAGTATEGSHRPHSADETLVEAQMVVQSDDDDDNIDDADVEASMNDQVLLQETEEQIRQRILQEEGVQVDDVVVMKDDNIIRYGKGKGSGGNQSTNKVLYLGTILIVIVVAAIVVPTTVVILGNNEKKKSENSINFNDLTFREQVLETLRPMYNNNNDNQDRNDEGENESKGRKMNFLNRPSIDIVHEIGTPQNLAFEWIVNTMNSLHDPPVLLYDRYDPHNIFKLRDEENNNNNGAGGGTNTSGIIVDDETDRQIKQQLLIERYVMALIYFSTNSSTWYHPFGFMEETKTVCLWFMQRYSNDDQGGVGVLEDEEIASTTSSVVSDAFFETTEQEDGDVEEDDDDNDDAPDRLEIGLQRLGVGFCHPENGSIASMFMWGNNLMGTIPYELSWLTNIHHIDFSYNHLTGTIPPELFDGSLPNMDFASFAANQLSGPLPSSKLNSVDSEGDEFDGGGDGYLDDAYWGDHVRKLEILELQHNQLSGTIPASLAAAPNLFSLHFGVNLLTGTIPDVFSSSQGFLAKIVLSYNLLSGPAIPASVTELSLLRQYSVNDNLLEGTIPTSISTWDDLEFLVLQNNLMGGSLPTEIGLLQDLKYVTLAINEFTGSLPSEVGLLEDLIALHLYNNKFTGTISDETFDGAVRTMTDMRISENQFSGTLPSSLGRMTSLGFLYIQNNSFTVDIDPLVCQGVQPFIDARADCLAHGDDVNAFLFDTSNIANSTTNTTDSSPPSKISEVKCTCCRQCCNDIEGCTPYTGFHACLLDKAVFDDDYCSCNFVGMNETQSADGNAAAGPTTSQEYDAYEEIAEYELTCSFPWCKLCDAYGDNCAFHTWGNQYNYRGEWLTRFDRYDYFTGRYTDRIVKFSNFYGGQCEVEVDGELCNGCWDISCPDGYSTYQVQCTNVEPRFPEEVGEIGLEFDGCFATEPTSSNTTSQSGVGELQVLFSPYKNGECGVYYPSYCIALVDRAYGTGNCQCTDDGYGFGCPNYGCRYCIFNDDKMGNGTSTNATADFENADCYIASSFYELYYDHLQIAVISNTEHYLYISSPPPPPSNNGSSTSPTTNSTVVADDDVGSNNNSTFVGSLLSHFTNFLDGSCVVAINGELCTNCTRVFCSPDDEVSTIQVDCSNVLSNTVVTNFDGCDKESWKGGRLGVLQALRYPQPECINENVTEYFF